MWKVFLIVKARGGKDQKEGQKEEMGSCIANAKADTRESDSADKQL